MSQNFESLGLRPMFWFLKKWTWKFEARGREEIFVGYDRGYAYRIYMSGKGTVVVSNDVRVSE